MPITLQYTPKGIDTFLADRFQRIIISTREFLYPPTSKCNIGLSFERNGTRVTFIMNLAK